MYMWFEAFPLAYGEVYGFGLGVSSLPFLSFVVASMPTVSSLPPPTSAEGRLCLFPRVDKVTDAS